MLRKLALLALALPLVALFALLLLGSSTSVLLKTHSELEISMSKNKAWERIMDFTAYPKWRRDITSVDKVYSSGSALSWKEISTDKSEATWELIDARPPDYVVLRRVLNHRAEDERWIFGFREAGDKTIVTIETREATLAPLQRAILRIRNHFQNPATHVLQSFATAN